MLSSYLQKPMSDGNQAGPRLSKEIRRGLCCYNFRQHCLECWHYNYPLKETKDMLKDLARRPDHANYPIEMFLPFHLLSLGLLWCFCISVSNYKREWIPQRDDSLFSPFLSWGLWLPLRFCIFVVNYRRSCVSICFCFFPFSSRMPWSSSLL